MSPTFCSTCGQKRRQDETDFDHYASTPKPNSYCSTCGQKCQRDGSDHYRKAPATDPIPEYKYEELVDKRGTLRLLNLLSSSPDNPQIDCELIVETIHHDNVNGPKVYTEYEALSWCWGTTLRTANINIRKTDGIYAKKVSPDLLLALRALRHPHKNRYLWIDAICIDQANKLEKNHQVEMMAVIYGEAQSVCVWLGDSNESSTMAIRFIQDEVLKLQDFDDLCESPEASKKWSSLLDLMQRQWFSRRWVVQEISLARKATIYCGADQIPWKDFAVAVELFVEVETATHRLSEVIKKDPKFYHVPRLFEFVSELGASLLVAATSTVFRDSKPTASFSVARPQPQPLLSLEYLVSNLSIFDVTMEHDTVYAMLAIAKDTQPDAGDREPALDRTKVALQAFQQRKSYPVEYEASYDDVCKNFIHFCMQRSDPSRALDIICRPWAHTSKNGTSRRIAQADPYTFNAPQSLPTWIPDLSGAAYAMYAHAGVHTFKMGRKNADTLVGLPSTFQRNYNAAESSAIDRKALRFRKRIGVSQNFSMYVKGFILDDIEEVFPASQGGAIPQEWIFAAGWSGAPETDPPDEFWRTLVADRGSHARNPPLYYSRACKESFMKGGLPSGSINTTDLINNERSSVVAQFCRRVQAVIWNRSLVKTASGNIGLSRKAVRRKDLVCILYGCSVPVILRRCKEVKPSQIAKLEMREDFEAVISRLQVRWKNRMDKNKLARCRLLLRLRPINFKRESPATRASNPATDGPVDHGESIKTESEVASVEETTEERKQRQEREFYIALYFGHRWKKIMRKKRRLRTLERITMSQAPPKMPDVSPVEERIDWDQIFDTWADKALAGEDKEHYSYYYSFLGEAYIHGMMDGEAMAHQNANELKKREFELR